MTLPFGTVVKAVTLVVPASGVIAARNTYHARIVDPAGVDEEDASDHWQAYITACFNAYKSIVHPAFRLAQISLYEVGGDTYLPPITLSIAGTGTGETYATGVCALVIAHTTRARCSARKYLGPLSEGSMNGNALIAGTLTAMTNFANVFKATFGGGGGDIWQPGVWSYEREEWYPIVDAVPVPYARYQTRRKAG